MSKLINPNDYIKPSTYAERYCVCVKKIYRHINDGAIDFIIIDNVKFIKNINYSTLSTDKRTKKGNANVTTLTLGNKNIKNPTQVFDLEEDSNVQTLTLPNVTTLTLQQDEILLLTKDEKECSLSDFQKIKEIKEKHNI